MSAQLSLLDAAPAHADTGDDHQWLPGEDVAADIQAVLSHIPGIGHARHSVRERVIRPLACLYVRTALLPQPERRVCQAMARQRTGFVDHGDGWYASGLGSTMDSATGIVRYDAEELWLRLNGETPRMGREATRSVRTSDRDYVWWLEFRHGDFAFGKVKHWIESVRPGLRALGCPPKSKGHSIRLRSLAPLILALRWSDHVAAAVFLAGSGVAPKSDEWAVLVDQALAHGIPWAEPLAELSARHPRDVMIRALGWVHAQGIERRRAR